MNPVPWKFTKKLLKRRTRSLEISQNDYGLHTCCSDAPPTGSNMKRMIYIHHDLIMRTSNHSSSSSPFPARRTSCVSSGLCSKKRLWSTNWAGSCTSTRPCCWYGPLKKRNKTQFSFKTTEGGWGGHVDMSASLDFWCIWYIFQLVLSTHRGISVW